MFAVIETGAKQYVVEPGKKIRVEKLDVAEGSEVTFDNVLLKNTDGKIEIGRPYVKGSSVVAKVTAQARDKKKIVFKFHSKNRFDKKKGHRQHYTEVEITGIK